MRLLRVAASCTVMALPGIAQAESLAIAGEEGGGWRYSITPYLFLPFSTEGTAAVEAGDPVSFQLDLGEVLDLLQGAASLRAEAWNGDFGLIGEVYYVNIADDASIDGGGPLGGSVDVDVDVKQTYWNFLAAYRFADGVNSAGHHYAFDVSGGLRWNSLTQDIDLDFSGVPLPDQSLGGTEQWWEPVVGIRGAVQVAEDWTLGARAEFAGFGVNGDDLQYTVLVGADWKAWERTSLKFGYQWYGIDFSTDDGDFAYDVDQNGLYLGLTLRY